MRLLTWVLFLTIGASSAAAQDNNRIRLWMTDGSTINAILNGVTYVKGQSPQPSFIVDTDYGSLTMPASDVYTATLGIHYHHGEREEIRKAVKLLCSQVHKERELAARFLLLKERAALPTLLLAQKYSKDAEVIRRAEELSKKIDADATDPDKLETDHFVTRLQPTIKCRLTALEFHCVNACLGNFKVQTADISKFCMYTGAHELTVDAAKTGWTETNILVEKGMTINVSAHGQVDIWPQTPGQYVCGPSGIQNQNGRGSVHRAGALIVRFGGSDTFGVAVGDRRSIVADRSGAIQFAIVQSPWEGSAPAGGYTVSVKVE